MPSSLVLFSLHPPGTLRLLNLPLYEGFGSAAAAQLQAPASSNLHEGRGRLILVTSICRHPPSSPVCLMDPTAYPVTKELGSKINPI